MHRMSFVAGAAAAFVVSAAGWSVLNSATVQPTAADRTLGAAMMYAVVTAEGALVRSSSDVVSATRLGTDGMYDVIFNRNIRSCSYVASAGSDGPVNSIAFVSAADVSGNTAGVRVQTRSSDGINSDIGFGLQVLCAR
jgi:hypothetical protein